MAIRYIDPCGDDYTYAQILDRWNSTNPDVAASPTVNGGVSINVGGGRCGGNCIAFSGSNLNSSEQGIWKTIDPQGTWIIGWAYYPASPLSAKRQSLLSIELVHSPQISITMNTDGTLAVYRGEPPPFSGSLLGTTTLALQASNWYYLEFKVVLDASAGSFELRVNGATRLSASGIDTRVSNTTANVIRLGGVASGNLLAPGLVEPDRIDDIYMADGQTNPDTFKGRVVDFVGDYQVLVKRANANGTHQQFTPLGAGDHYVEIDETTPDSNTTYLASSTVGHEESNNIENLTAGQLVAAAQLVTYDTKQDAGVRSFKQNIRLGGTDYYGPTEFFPTAVEYIFHTEALDRHPNTGAQLTVSDLNSAEIGVRIET